MTWTVIEPGVYLIAICLPSLRLLLRLAFKNVDFAPCTAASATPWGLPRARLQIFRSRRGMGRVIVQVAILVIGRASVS